MTVHHFVDTSGHYLGYHYGPIEDLNTEFSQAHKVAEPPPNENQRWDFDNEVWVYVEPEPQPEIPPTPSITASAKLTVDNGVMGGFTTDSRIAGGFQLDVGKYMLIFNEPINSPYIVSAFDGGLFRIYVDPNDYAEDYFIVTCTDLTGSPSDPENLSIIIITT